METETLYAVVLTFPDGIARALDGIREDYRQYVGYKIEPHITLKMPFSPVADEKVIHDALKRVADETRPFALALDGARFFEGPNNVAYMSVEGGRQIVELHIGIVNSLRGLVRETGREIYELDGFTPHMTLGECIPAEVFPEVKKELSGLSLRFECLMSSFSLYSGTFKSRWLPERVFDFSSNKGGD